MTHLPFMTTARRGAWILLAALAGWSAHAQAADAVTTGTRDPARKDVEGVRTRSTDAKPADPVAERVRGRFAERFSGLPVTAVTRTPYGFFEVQVGSDLIYTDEDVRWVMQGPLVDAQSREDLSAKRLEEMSAIEFDTLPLDLAVKAVKGDGSRKIAVFADPNCGYCKQLEKTLQSVDNVTVHTFLLPILSADSEVKSHDVWCASDREQAWDDWMLRNKAPAATDRAKCTAPVDEVRTLAQKLMVRGTPAIYFADGTRSAGALPLEALNQRLQRK